MKTTIAELWNGQIVPVERCGTHNTEIEELIRLIDRNKTNLVHTLNDCQKDLFEKYIDCADEYLDLMTEEAFCKGFCLGSKFLAEALTMGE